MLALARTGMRRIERRRGLPRPAVDRTGGVRKRMTTSRRSPALDGRGVHPAPLCGCCADNVLNGYYRPEPAVAAQEIEPHERQRTHRRSAARPCRGSARPSASTSRLRRLRGDGFPSRSSTWWALRPGRNPQAQAPKPASPIASRISQGRSWTMHFSKLGVPSGRLPSLPFGI